MKQVLLNATTKLKQVQSELKRQYGYLGQNIQIGTGTQKFDFCKTKSTFEQVIRQ